MDLSGGGNHSNRETQGIYQKWQQHKVPGPYGHTLKGPQGDPKIWDPKILLSHWF